MGIIFITKPRQLQMNQGGVIEGVKSSTHVPLNDALHRQNDVCVRVLLPGIRRCVCQTYNLSNNLSTSVKEGLGMSCKRPLSKKILQQQ